MDLDHSHPSLDDLKRRAKRRIPHFVWEFLDSGTGDDFAHQQNKDAFRAISLMPDVLTGGREPDFSTRFLGHDYGLPFGIAPVGMSGLIWPNGEAILARVARETGMPYCMSTMASMSPEQVAGDLGNGAWFQLYPPGDPDLRRDILARARDAGFKTMVLTVDIPAASRRERQRRADIRQPATITPRIALQCALRPEWSLGMLKRGRPTLATLAKYADVQSSKPGTDHIGYRIRVSPDWSYLETLRKEWDGPLIVKGVMSPEPAKRMVDMGVDAIWVSNHGGRQFDAVPPAIEVLPQIRSALGPDMPIVFCSGVQTGTDVLRAIGRGADFVMLGRAFHYGMGAFGERGARHVADILKDSLKADMGQMGITRPTDVRARLAP
ncbi:MAG: alpha-hydroxy acid oxidase [Pseudomonadota bacterium]